MKKYTIKDNLGNKKTIFAKDLAHAIKLNDNLDNDIYNALVKVSKNKNTHSSFGWNGIIEGMVENILINKGIIKKEDRFKVRKQIQQQMKESRIQKLFKDSIKDEANLPTTIQALVNDEEAAIKAYEVAIKNLEGKIDETQMQVLINIMKDERRHVENLYSILNGNITEKNLEE